MSACYVTGSVTMPNDTNRRHTDSERTDDRPTNPPTHQFAIGSFDCHIVQDGSFAYPHPAEVFFTNASETDREQALRDHGIDPIGWDEYVSPYPSVLIETSQDTVLIDTGAGDLAPTTGNLRSNLHEAGIAPPDIDTVVLTHGHPDHVGGCVDDEGEPAFPDARYVMADTEWDFWTSDPDLSGLAVDAELKTLLRDIPQKTLPPVEGNLELIDADTETEIVPGIRALPAPGHTPGHMAVSVTSGDDYLLHIVDTVLHPIHLRHPEWFAAIDYNPDQLMTTRNRLLEDAATEHALVIAYHFPAPGLGRITEAGGAWDWQPMES